jgi:HEAT repeat protein
MTRVDELKRHLSSLDPRRRRQALFAAVQEDAKELSSYVLSIFRRETNGDVKGLCAWALGRFMCREAYADLVKGLQTGDPEVRTWSAWALGEMGFHEAAVPLGRALNSEGNPAVRRAIGGAVRKLRLDTTRVHVSQAAKGLQPPPTEDGRIQSIVEKLASLEWPGDREAIIDLRREMQEVAPQYFETYMEWLRRKPLIESAVIDKRKVYTDFE